MKTDHTPEPLHYMPLPAADGTFMVLGGQGQDYGLVASCTTEEDARRIVACVNACAGISTENLEDNKPIIELANAYNVALRQRDELLAALEYIRGLAACEEVRDFPTIHNTANAAIASVKADHFRGVTKMIDEASETSIPAIVFYPAGSLGEPVDSEGDEA